MLSRLRTAGERIATVRTGLQCALPPLRRACGGTGDESIRESCLQFTPSTLSLSAAPDTQPSAALVIRELTKILGNPVDQACFCLAALWRHRSEWPKVLAR